MFDDDIDPRTKKLVLKDLSTMSVEELQKYKDQLLSEAERVETVIKSKSDYFSEADKFFK
jgi:uncharacterized small protein (DUF1192 family)